MTNEEREAWAEVIARGKLGRVWFVDALKERPVGVIILIDEKAKYILGAKGEEELELRGYPEGGLV
jgi:hypothetical protein